MYMYFEQSAHEEKDPGPVLNWTNWIDLLSAVHVHVCAAYPMACVGAERHVHVHVCVAEARGASAHAVTVALRISSALTEHA